MTGLWYNIHKFYLGLIYYQYKWNFVKIIPWSIKSAVKYAETLALRLSSNMISDTFYETNFPNKLLLTARKVSKIRKAVAYNSFVNINLSKTWVSKIIKLGGFLGRLLGPLTKVGFLLIKNVIKPSPKNILIPLILTTAATAKGVGIYKKLLVGEPQRW